MSTKRLLVSLEEEVFNEIQTLAQINHLSLSKIAKNLINASLELQEDAMFSKLSEQRLKETKAWVSHEDAWK